MSQISHWQVQISNPQKSFNHTRDVHVLAPEMMDALIRVGELFPNARIFNCVHKGTFEDDHYVRPKNNDFI